MFYFVLVLHLVLCVILVGLVLLQQGKGADMGAAFGSGGANTLFGATGATSLIIKLTTGACILFMMTSIFLVRHYQNIAGDSGAPDVLQGSLFKGAASSARSVSSVPSEPEAPITTQPQAVNAPIAAVSSQAADSSASSAQAATGVDSDKSTK